MVRRRQHVAHNKLEGFSKIDKARPIMAELSVK
jgi:hypothetical protein